MHSINHLFLANLKPKGIKVLLFFKKYIKINTCILLIRITIIFANEVVSSRNMIEVSQNINL